MRTICECGTRLDADGACSTCEMLRRPAQRRRGLERVLRERTQAGNTPLGIGRDLIREAAARVDPRELVSRAAARERSLRGLWKHPRKVAGRGEREAAPASFGRGAR